MKLYKIVFSGFLLAGTLLVSCSEAAKETGYGPSTRGPKDTRIKDTIAYEKFGFTNLAANAGKKEMLSQVWDLKEDLDDVLEAQYDGSSTIDMVSRGFVFFNTGQVIRDPRGGYETGSWELDETQQPMLLKIKYRNGSPAMFNILKLSATKMVLQRTSREAPLEYKAQGIGYANEKDNPFALENNQWRIAPAGPETTEEIKKRLKDNIHFFIMFYDHNISSKSATVNFTGLPTCFKWYAGGIFLHKKEALSPMWINCFFNKKQAYEAYEMADKLLEKKYTWPKGESNWLKQNVFVLRQMEQQLLIDN